MGYNTHVLIYRIELIAPAMDIELVIAGYLNTYSPGGIWLCWDSIVRDCLVLS